MKNQTYIFFDFAGTLVKMRPATLLVEKKQLDRLSKYFLLGIITGARKAETLNILQKLNIKDIFTTIVASDDTIYKKPDKRVFPRVNIKFYIGDTKKDELLAKNAKVTFFRINNKYNINNVINNLKI